MKTDKDFPLNEKLARLEEIERLIQSSDMPLDKALEAHKEALSIAKEVQKFLLEAQNTLEEIDIASLRKEV